MYLVFCFIGAFWLFLTVGVFFTHYNLATLMLKRDEKLGFGVGV